MANLPVVLKELLNLEPRIFPKIHADFLGLYVKNFLQTRPIRKKREKEKGGGECFPLK